MSIQVIEHTFDKNDLEQGVRVEQDTPLVFLP